MLSGGRSGKVDNERVQSRLVKVPKVHLPGPSNPTPDHRGEGDAVHCLRGGSGTSSFDHRGVFGRPQALSPTCGPNMHSTIIPHPIR